MNEMPEKVSRLQKWLESDSPLLRLIFVRRILEAQREKHLEWVIIDVCIVVVLIVLGFSAKPAYRAFRENQINRNLEAAKTAARNQDWNAARDTARSVLMARPQDFDAYRLWTRALGKMGTPDAYLAAAEVFTCSRANRADLLEALEVMGLQAPQVVALSAHASLPEPLRNQAVFRAAIVPLLIQRGQIELAENCLREVAQPDDGPKVGLALLRVLCCRPTPGHIVEARRIFADLIATHADEQALAALLILGDAPGGLIEGVPLPDLPQWLTSQPLATALHHLLGLHPELRAHPDSAPQVFASAIKRFLATDPAVLGIWLMRHDQTEMAVNLLDEPAKTRSDAFIARLTALMCLKRDAAITAALASPPDSVDLVELEVMQATLAANHGDLIASGAAWTRALNHAAYDTTRNRCIDIAHIAERHGAKDAAEDAWVAAVRLGWGQLPPYADLSPVFTSLLAKGRSEDLMAMLRTMLRFEPHNPDLLNNAYYFAMIEGTQPPSQVATVISKLIEREDKPVYNSKTPLPDKSSPR